MASVTLTPEQARLLIPILQQITEKDGSKTPSQHGTPTTSTASSSSGSRLSDGHSISQSPYLFANDSAFSTSASEAESQGCRYDVNDLFSKKKKNTKSTEAQSYLCVSS